MIYCEDERFSILKQEFVDGKLYLTFKVTARQAGADDDVNLYLKDKLSGEMERFLKLYYFGISSLE